MITITLRETFGEGGYDETVASGNLVERVTATQADDGTWTVTTESPEGVETRPADGAEAADLDARLAPAPTPAPDPAMTDFVATLTDEQKAALKLALGTA